MAGENVTLPSLIVSSTNQTQTTEYEDDTYILNFIWAAIIVLFLIIISWICCKSCVLNIFGFRKEGPASGSCAACWQSCYDGEVPADSLFSRCQSAAMKN